MRALALALLTAACAAFPEVDRAERNIVQGPLPVLLPTDDLLARAAGSYGAEAAGNTLAARAAALRLRAARLRAMPVT